MGDHFDMNSFFENLDWIENHFMEIKPSEQVALDMKYATRDNFMKRDIYNGFHRCFVAPLTHLRFVKACEDLKTRRPDLQFLIWDTLRPRSIQKIFFEHLAGTPFQNYVAAPYPGSLHNFGMAMDLTLQTKNGLVLDMGTDFDDFRDLAQPKLEQEFLRSGQLSQAQFENRKLLRDVMEAQGFKVLEHEWWHFNTLPKDQVHGVHSILE